MVLPAEVARVSLHWSWAPNSAWPSELMVNTFWLSHEHQTGNSWSWNEEVQNAADKIAQKLVSHWGAISTMFVQAVKIDGVKVAQLDPNGHTVSEGAHSITDSSLQGTGGSGQLPPETAAVLGLWGYTPGTFVQHKGRKRGRMYLGGLSKTRLGDNGLYNGGYTDADLQGWQAFFNDVQGMEGGSDPIGVGDHDYWKCGIASSVDATFTQLDQISLDDEFGSQRRRQNGRKATRTLKPIDHASG